MNGGGTKNLLKSFKIWVTKTPVPQIWGNHHTNHGMRLTERLGKPLVDIVFIRALKKYSPRAFNSIAD
ncbi:unnamed protein product [Prunus armeniaca]